MSRNSILGRFISEEVFYKAVVALLVGLPVLEFFTEILCRFNDDIIPSFFQPQLRAASHGDNNKYQQDKSYREHIGQGPSVPACQHIY